MTTSSSSPASQTTNNTSWSSAPAAATTLQVGETEVHLLKGGSGRPALVLHGIEGPEGWLAFHEALAANATVYAPAHPGYGETRRPEWLESISHQALFYNWFLQEAGLDEVDLVGFGIGGWIAAEMATMAPRGLRHLVLAGPAGIRPRESQLLDVFVIPWQDVVRRCFYDADDCEEYLRIYSASPVVNFGGEREAGRSMTMRMCYRPYMYSSSLQP
ncbi:MAG TPA: alpha/beta fold hydrolase, partial [Dehalococcoidia bacterium]|nr:alpha/beta fold hydrolase [Dehalococcoidia bacterium]